jgi:hypothetical protein
VRLIARGWWNPGMKGARKKDGKGRRIAALEARVTGLEEQVRFYRDQRMEFSAQAHRAICAATELRNEMRRDPRGGG